MKSLILLLILASFSPAQAQMSCMDIFNHSRPTEEQINTAIFDLQHLLSEQYSKDLTVARFAKFQSVKKLSELKQFLTESEIKERLKNINLSKTEQSDKTQAMSRQLDNEIHKTSILVQNFLDAHNLKDFSAKNRYSESALILAIRENNIEVIEALIYYAANLNIKNYEGYTALIIAAHEGKKEALELLIKAGANINAKTNDGETALILAAIGGNKGITELLIKNGADINIKDAEDRSALMYAMLNGHKGITKALEKAGAE